MLICATEMRSLVRLKPAPRPDRLLARGSPCRKPRLGQDPPEPSRVVHDQAVGVYRQVGGETAVEAQKPVESTPAVLLEAGVALRFGPGLQLGPVK